MEKYVVNDSGVLNLKAHFYYPEDCVVNGKDDDNENPVMPFIKKGEDGLWCWDVKIDINTGKILCWLDGTTARTFYKTSDNCEIIYLGKRYCEYVPKFLQIFSNGYGDYIHIEILEDGTIKNWNSVECRMWLDENQDKFE